MTNGTFHDRFTFRVVLEVQQPDTEGTYEFEVETADSVHYQEAQDEALKIAATEGLITHAIHSVKQVERDQ